MSYIPDAGFSGVDTFSYTVSDGNGGTATATVTVSVAAVNDLPVAQDDSEITDEEIPVIIYVLLNDSDPGRRSPDSGIGKPTGKWNSIERWNQRDLYSRGWLQRN